MLETAVGERSIEMRAVDWENARRVTADPERRCAGARGAARRAAEAAEAAMADMSTGTARGTWPACVRVCAGARDAIGTNEQRQSNITIKIFASVRLGIQGRRSSPHVRSGDFQIRNASGDETHAVSSK